MKTLKFALFVLMLTGLLAVTYTPAAAANGTTIEIIVAYDSGWYDIDGSHIPSNTNYAVGDFQGNEGNDFFAFNLSAVSGEIVSATLEVYNPPSGFTSP